MLKILNKINMLHKIQQSQRGAVLMVMLVILIVGASAMLLNSLNGSALFTGRDKITTDALAQAREALVGYAVKVKISSSTVTDQPRPGDLPCPDIHPLGDSNEGLSSAPCSGNAIGRLPWKTLGLPELRDSNNERLWYAVSANFKNSPRTGILNSDTVGSITVRDSAGNIVNNGCTTLSPNCLTPGPFDAAYSTGVVAVIIAPGAILQRQGGSMQDRSVAGYNTTSNYLDIITLGGSPHDNANFIDGSSTNGFIQGRIIDNDKNIIVNDQLLAITQDSIMQSVQKRVAAEVKSCLNDYALNNNNRYPWAAPLNDLTTYLDSTNLLFGRIPNDLSNSQTSCGGSTSNAWTAACNTHMSNTPSNWWLNWREMVFYGIANAYKPGLTAPACGSCLVVTNASAVADKKFVVIVAGKMLPTQTNRPTNQSTLNNYLESPNSTGATTFTQGSASAAFNDTLVYQQ